MGTARVAAFVATLVLVLQSALAFAAPPVQRDIFGNVICVEGSTGQSPARRDHGGGHMPDCCMLACGATLQAAAAGLPAATHLPIVDHAAQPAVRPTAATTCRHDRRTPANPRAPPAAA